MTDAARALVQVSAALAAGSAGRLEDALRAAAATTDPGSIEEVLLQSYLFLGYPAALRGLAVWRRVAPAAEPVSRRDEEEWEARGRATCERVYGGQYERLRANIAALHPDMERWMIVEGYGKVIGRPGLELATRELCIIALLAPQDAAPQLYSHMRGALNAGASSADVEETLGLLAAALSAERRNAAERQWTAVMDRRNRQES
jgi:4-carboxymuconolactone decarboxylase